jgi:O-antigen/teichoic acid export membrane protein
MNDRRGMSRVSANAISNYIGQSYSMLIMLSSVPIYIKFLGAEAFGLIGFFVLLQNFTGLLDFGLSATINRQVARARASINGFASFKNLLRTIEVGFMIVSLAIIVTMYLSSSLLANNWIKSVKLNSDDISYCLELMALIISLKLYSTFYRSGINGFEDQVWNNKNFALINTLKYVGAIILLIFISQEITIYFEYQLVIAGFEVALLHRRLHRNISSHVISQRSIKIEWFEIAKIMPFSMSIAYTSAAVIVIMQLDKLLLSSSISLEELGYLNIISTITGLILVMATPIFLAYLPKITMLATNKQTVEMKSAYTEMTKLLTLFTATITAMIACNAPSILYAITGSIGAQVWGADVLIYYAIGTGFYVLGSAQYYILNAFGNLRLYVIGCTASLVILTPIIYLITQSYGVLGASRIWMFYGFTWFTVWGGLVHHKALPTFHLKWLMRDILPLLISVIIVTFIVSRLINIGHNESRILIVAEGLIIGTVVLIVNAFWLSSFRTLVKRKLNKNNLL